MAKTVTLPKNILRRGARFALRKVGLQRIQPAEKKSAAMKDSSAKEALKYLRGVVSLRPSTVSSVVVYFDGTMAQWYQIEMWLDILAELNQIVHTSLIVRNIAVFRKIVGTTDLSATLCITIDDVMQVYENSNIKCILYVNHAAKNFQSLINKDALHIHINHGESDKLSTITNQANAYDYVYVVGDAAYERYDLNLLRRDISRFIRIGRPQLEHVTPYPPEALEFTPIVSEPLGIAPHSPMNEEAQSLGGDLDLQSALSTQSNDITDPIPAIGGPNDMMTRPEIVPTPVSANKKIVLYAPTWEGTHHSMDYSSVPIFGVELVQRLLEHPEYRVIYKPHPKVGVRDPRALKAHNEIIRNLGQSPDGKFLGTGDINSLYPHIDIPIFDNSTVTIDYLMHDKPFLMTNMFHRATGREDRPPIMNGAKLITGRDINDIVPILETEMRDDPYKAARNKVKTHYLGDFDYANKESTAAFISHIQQAMQERDTLIAERKSRAKAAAQGRE